MAALVDDNDRCEHRSRFQDRLEVAQVYARESPGLEFAVSAMWVPPLAVEEMGFWAETEVGEGFREVGFGLEGEIGNGLGF